MVRIFLSLYLFFTVCAFGQQGGKMGTNQSMNNVQGGVQINGSNNNVKMVLNPRTTNIKQIIVKGQAKIDFCLIKINVNTKSVVYEDGNQKGIAEVGKPLILRLGRGEHRLDIKSAYLEYANNKANVMVTKDMIGTEQYLDVSFRICEYLAPLYTGAQDENTVGFINIRTNEIPLPFQFSLGWERISNDVIVVKQKGKWGYIDSYGRFIVGDPPEDNKKNLGGYQYIDGLIKVREGFLFGLKDYNNSYFLKVEFDQIIRYKGNDLIAVGKRNNKAEGPTVTQAESYEDFYICNDCQWGLYDRNGYLRLPLIYDKILFKDVPKTSDGRTVVARKNEQWEVLRVSDGKPYLLTKFSSVDIYGDGFVGVQIGDKAGVLGTNYQPVIPLQYDGVYCVKDTVGKKDHVIFFMVAKGDKIALFDRAGSQLTDFLFDAVGEYFNKGLCTVVKDSFCAYVNLDAKLITEFRYDAEDKDDLRVRTYFDYIVVKRNGKQGLMDTEGSEVVPTEFDEFGEGFYAWNSGFNKTTYSDNRGFVRKGELYGLSDQHGKLITPIHFQYLGGFSNGKKAAVVKLNGKYGLIGRGGKFVLSPTLFTQGEDWSGNLFRFKVGNNYTYTDDQGKFVAGSRQGTK
jgi:hypothetical protein